MTFSMLVREVWISTRTRLFPAIMVAVLCGSMCATTLLTVGRTASAEAEVLARMDRAGARELIVADRNDAGLLSAAIVDAVGGLDTVERAVGLTIALDVRSGHLADGGTQVPSWGVVGEMEDVVTLLRGRPPREGEALVSEAAMAQLGLDQPVGVVVRGLSEYAVVGSFAAREPFGDLEAGVVIAAVPGTPARALHVISTDADAVSATQRLTLGMIAAPRPEDLSIQSPASLAELRGGIAGDLGAFGRQLLLLVLGAGAALTAVVVLTDVLLRRADLGRRRALGATRRGLVALVMLRVLLAALFGVVLGTVGALVILARWGAQVPGDFVGGTVVLTVLAAVVAAVGPAVIAATRDPVSVLRTP